jgi:hypothetical protein
MLGRLTGVSEQIFGLFGHFQRRELAIIFPRSPLGGAPRPAQ